jgi:ribosomal subunit interface protein
MGTGMKISITGKQMGIGPKLKEYVETNLEGSIKKYFSDIISSNVAFSKEGPQVKVDISVHPKKGILLQANAVGEDAFSVFDSANEHLGTRLRKYKNRLKDHKGKMSGGEAASLAVIAPELPGEDEATLPEEDSGPVVVAELEAEIPLCTVSGAVMRMDLADASALMFRNSAHGGLNMVYRRNDGHIGWVDPSDESDK